jgi:hypothetical protein
MGRLKVEEKRNCCDGCQVEFNSDLKYYAMNMCEKCYMTWKLPKRKNKEVPTNCLSCKLEFGSTNDNGKKVKHQAGGQCSKCYMKIYSVKEGRKCIRCERDLYKTTKDICRVCRDIQKEEYYKVNKKAANQSKLYKEKLKALNKELTYEKFELIRRLLSRFKFNYYTYCDFFRVVDIYIDIFNHEAHLDSYSENEQIEIMLRRLKEVWIYNKEVRENKSIIEKDKLLKKKKRCLKN